MLWFSGHKSLPYATGGIAHLQYVQKGWPTYQSDLMFILPIAPQLKIAQYITISQQSRAYFTVVKLTELERLKNIYLWMLENIKNTDSRKLDTSCCL